MSDDTNQESAQETGTLNLSDETIGGLAIGLTAAVLLYLGWYIPAVTLNSPALGDIDYSFSDVDAGIMAHGPAYLLICLALMSKFNVSIFRYIAWFIVVWLTIGIGMWVLVLWYLEPAMAIYFMSDAANQPVDPDGAWVMYEAVRDSGGQEALQKTADLMERGLWHQAFLIVGLALYWFAFMAIREVQFENMYAAQTEEE